MELAHLNLIENAGDGIFLLDTRGDFVLVNRRFEKVSGYTSEEMLGRPFQALLAPNQMATVNEALTRLLASDSEFPLRLKLEILDRQEQTIPVELTASVVRHGDSVSGIMGIVREMSEKPVEVEVTPHSEEDQRRAEEWATIYNIGLAITLSLNPAEVLRLIYAQLPFALSFTAVAIALTGPGDDEISFEFVVRHGEPLPPFRRELDAAGLCGWVVREARPLLIGDWQDDEERNRVIHQDGPLHIGNWEDEVSSFAIEPVVIAESVRSWLGVPLVARERTIGVIALLSETPYAYDEHHQRFLYAIADQAAMAIANARLYEEQRRRAVQLETVHEVSQRIVSILDVDDLLNQVVALILSHRGYDHVHIFLVNAERTGLEFRAGTGPVARAMLHQRTHLPIGDQGLVSWVAATGESILCNDVTADPRYRHYEPLAQAKAEVSVPLRTGGQVLGVLVVQSERKDAFDEGDLFVLQSLADMVAVSIQTAHLFREQERRIEESTTLREIGETIVSSLDLDETLTAIMQRVNAVFQVEAGSLMLEENGRLVYCVTLSPQAPEVVKQHTLAMGQGIAGWVAQHGIPLLVPDARADARWYPNVDAESGFETRSILCVPMKAKDKVIGVIEIFNPIGGRQFTDRDRRLLESIATSAVIAIKNAQLYQQTEQRLAEVSTLYILAEQTTSSLELPVVLDAIVTTLKRVLDCRGCRIFLLDEEIQQLEIKASSGVATEGHEITKMRIGEGVSGQVVKLAKPIHIPDTRLEPSFPYFDEQVRSLLVVPLISKDQPIGTLSVDDLKPHAFSADDSRLLTIAAAQAAVAIENARLFEHLKERAQKLAEAYAELQEADRKKDELFQNVSHELRTPLTFVKAYVELFLEETLGPVTDAQRESLEIVARRTDAIARRVDDLLIFKQLDREAMSMGPVAMDELVREVVRGAEATVAQVGLGLRVEVAGSLPLAYGDRDRLTQVLDNLLGNAIKFSPDRGMIMVRVRPVDATVQVEVADEGIGIPADKLEKVFERFYQVDGSSRRRFGGTGLGLAIVTRIIEAHNGRVWVESELDKGSTFFFTVPALPPDDCEHEPAPSG